MNTRNTYITVGHGLPVLEFSMLALTIIALPIIVAFFGGVGAYIVGLVFEDGIRNVLRSAGVNLDSCSMFQIGATLAFVGSYFRVFSSGGSK